MHAGAASKMKLRILWRLDMCSGFCFLRVRCDTSSGVWRLGNPRVPALQPSCVGGRRAGPCAEIAVGKNASATKARTPLRLRSGIVVPSHIISDCSLYVVRTLTRGEACQVKLRLWTFHEHRRLRMARAASLVRSLFIPAGPTQDGQPLSQGHDAISSRVRCNKRS